MNRKQLFGSILLTLTALIWGVAFVAQRSGSDKIGAATFTSSRMTLAAVAVGLVSPIRDRFSRDTGDPGDERSDKRRATVVGGCLCGVLLTVSTLLQQMGLEETSAGKAGFITALYILIVPILNLVLFRQKTSWQIWAAVAVGLSGMYLLCVKEGFSFARGDLLICGCALLFSGHILCCDRFVRRADPIRMSAIQFAVSALLSAVIALLTEHPTWDQITSAAIPILYCGVLSGGVGYTLQMIAQRFTDPTVASLLMSLESVFAALAGALILKERMSVRELCGCIVLFAAIVAVQLPSPHIRSNRKEPLPAKDKEDPS